MTSRWFAHVDMDAFYASVEILDRPELEGLPVAVGGPAGQRGVIAAASYPARRFGVRSAMPTALALQLCPQLVLLPGRMERYQQLSRQVMGLLRQFAPAVEPLSLDEATLDLSGCERLYGDWPRLGLRMQERIYAETGLWCSIGMGETRRIAKIASDLHKPRGLVVIELGSGASFLQSLPVERLWGVGPKLTGQLHALGLKSAADIARCSRNQLQTALGKRGLLLHDIVHARELGGVDPEREHKSISHEITFARDRVGATILPTLLGLCEKVGHRLRQHGCQGKVVQLKIRDRGFHTFTRRITLSSPTDSASIVYEHAKRLWAELRWERVPVRLIGVGVQQLSSLSARQGDLFLDTGMRRNQLEQTLDSVQERFGRGAIRRAGTLLDDAPAWQSELYRPLDEVRRPHPAPLPSPRFPSTSASGRSAHVQPS